MHGPLLTTQPSNKWNTRGGKKLWLRKRRPTSSTNSSNKMRKPKALPPRREASATNSQLRTSYQLKPE